jgi:hypothetical protein
MQQQGCKDRGAQAGRPGEKEKNKGKEKKRKATTENGERGKDYDVGSWLLGED